MLEKARTRMCDDGIAADDRYTVQQDRTSLLMLTTIAARAARCCARPAATRYLLSRSDFDMRGFFTELSCKVEQSSSSLFIFSVSQNSL